MFQKFVNSRHNTQWANFYSRLEVEEGTGETFVYLQFHSRIHNHVKHLRRIFLVKKLIAFNY